MTHDPDSSVFMVASGRWRDGKPEITTFVESQIASLQQSGWRVTIGLIDDRTSVDGIWRNIRRLQQEVAVADAGLVHAQYGSVTAAVARVIKGPRPLVISFCGDDLLGTPNPGWVWRVRERFARFLGLWAAQRAKAIIVKSDNLLQALPGRLRDHATVLPNGVDMDWFHPMDREACRANLGWDSRNKVVLFNAGRYSNQNVKNLPLARATVECLAHSVPGVALQIMSHATPDRVRLMMNAADCLLLTSFHEGSPNLVKEAMACNLPVVSVPCGDVAERLGMTHPGAICPYDPTALAEGIQQVFAAGSRSNGRDQLIAQRLTTQLVAERLSRLYRQSQHGAFQTR